MTRIGVLGDVHATYYWVSFALWKFHNEGITHVVQVGDFGLGRTNYNRKFVHRVGKLATHYGITFDIVPGNHEDWDWIDLLTKGNRTEKVEIEPNLFILPRGYRWEEDGSTFVALGGAPSVDRAWRQEEDKGVLNSVYHRWFPTEIITQEDVDYVVAGGHADVMFGHDAPDGVSQIHERIKHNPIGFTAADLLYAADGRRLYTEAFRGVNPSVLFHGHYHFRVDEMIRNATGEYTNILGLTNEDSAFSMGHYDTETKKGHIWNTTPDFQKFLALWGKNVSYKVG